MRIMILAQHYAPEEVSGAVLATELATDLVKRGHQVSFVTCAPNYPAGQVHPGYRNSFLSRERRDGVQIVRVWSYISPSRSFWSRILNYGTFSLFSLLGGLLAGKPQAILSYSPPLPLGITAWILGRVWRVAWILRVEDLYPEAAVAAGILRNRWAIVFFSNLEKFIYQRAAHISVISPGFRENLRAKGVPENKLSVEPVWADPESLSLQPKENQFRETLSLQGKFVVLYAGNLGHTSALDDVLEAAWLLREQENICFLIVGEGVKKQELQAYAEQKQLERVIFLPYQSRAIYPQMMAAADVSLVTLNPASSPYSLPSKVFGVMASGRPLLAVAPEDSEIARMVREASCGVVVLPGKSDQLADTLLKLVGDKNGLNMLGMNGRRFLETYFARSACIDQYEARLKQVIG